MSKPSIGVAVIGAGMAGRAHASGYRSAPAVFGTDLPEVRLVAIADVHEPFAVDTARRYGYQRAETSWEAIAAAADIDAVSVVVANKLHREIVEALLDAGKHVLCEKPLAPSVADGQAMVDRAEKSDRVAAVGFTFRRSPAINAIREQITDGSLGPAVHFSGRYWCDYGVNPDAPMSWRYRGGPGSGALADIGTHLVDFGEFLCGPVQSVHGAVLKTTTRDRPVPLGTAVGHAAGVPVSDVREPVENEDIATFTAAFAGGATGTFSVSRVAYGLPNALGFEVFCQTRRGRLRSQPGRGVHNRRPGGGRVGERVPPGAASGRPTLISPGACRWTFPASATGRTTSSPSRRGPSWMRSPGWTGCRAAPRLAEGLHNLRVLDAVVAAAVRARPGGRPCEPWRPRDEPAASPREDHGITHGARGIPREEHP